MVLKKAYTYYNVPDIRDALLQPLDTQGEFERLHRSVAKVTHFSGKREEDIVKYQYNQNDNEPHEARYMISCFVPLQCHHTFKSTHGQPAVKKAN